MGFGGVPVWCELHQHIPLCLCVHFPFLHLPMASSYPSFKGPVQGATSSRRSFHWFYHSLSPLKSYRRKLLYSRLILSLSTFILMLLFICMALLYRRWTESGIKVVALCFFFFLGGWCCSVPSSVLGATGTQWSKARKWVCKRLRHHIHGSLEEVRRSGLIHWADPK